MAKVVSNIPTIWEDEVYSVLCLIKKIIKNINTNVIPQINENSKDIESLQGNITTINNALSTINTTLTNHDKRITSNTSQINTINGAIETIQDQIVTINDKLAYFSDRINSNTTQLGKIQQTVNQHNTAIAGLGESISDLEDNVSTLETTVSRHTTEIGNINSKLTGYDQRITSNTNQISQLKTNITSINGNISDMQQQINSADNTIEQHTSQIGKLEDSVESVEGELEGYNNKFNNLEYLTEVVMDTNNLFTIPDAGINYLVNWGGKPPGDIIIRLPTVGPGSGSYKVQHIYFQWPAGTKNSFNLLLQNSTGTFKPFTIGNNGMAPTGATLISYPAGMNINYENTYLGHLEIVYRGSSTTTNALVRLV